MFSLTNSKRIHDIKGFSPVPPDRTGPESGLLVLLQSFMWDKDQDFLNLLGKISAVFLF